MSRKCFLFCLRAQTGNRFAFPQVEQQMTKTSAHRFLPPLLAFSTMEWQFWPSMRTVSQNLQMALFMAGLWRTCPLRDMARTSDTI